MKLEFNKGDMVLCKKNFCPNTQNQIGLALQGSYLGRSPSTFNNGIFPTFIKDEEYKLDYANFWNNETNVVVYITNNHTFYHAKRVESPFEKVDKFEDYFYTKKELRNLKINKLNET